MSTNIVSGLGMGIDPGLGVGQGVMSGIGISELGRKDRVQVIFSVSWGDSGAQAIFSTCHRDSEVQAVFLACRRESGVLSWTYDGAPQCRPSCRPVEGA